MTKRASVLLTKRVVDAAGKKDRRYYVWDSVLSGFGIRIETSGAKTFIIEENSSDNLTPQYYYTPANSDMDLFRLDPYPVQTNVPNNLSGLRRRRLCVVYPTHGRAGTGDSVGMGLRPAEPRLRLHL